MQWQADRDIRLLENVVLLARKGIATLADKRRAGLTLGSALCQLGRYEEAAQMLRSCLLDQPSCELHLQLAHALMGQDNYEDALEQVMAARALAPDHQPARDFERDVLLRLKREPSGDAGPATLHWRDLTQQARMSSPQEVLALCDNILETAPANTNAKYEKARALARLGRDDDARAVMAMDALLWQGELAVPPGYDSGEAFRAALADDIRANPTLDPDPRGKTTTGGRQTRMLRQPGAMAIEALLPLLRQAVDRYVENLEARAHSFLQGRPPQVKLMSWAVVYGVAGFQTAHRHPGGWISGVYYVAAPRPGGENAYRGALHMGAQDDLTPPWGVTDIEPVPGRVVLFPSYVPHATSPSGIDGARISIAFDVLPVTAPA
jgi:tetratricopeptide (TPR) repeat protein